MRVLSGTAECEDSPVTGGAQAGALGAVPLARAPEPDPVRVDLVRGLRVTVDGRTLGPRDLGGVKPRLLLVALVLAHGAPVSKDRLVDLLWGDAPPAAAVPALESYVSVLRTRLGATRGRKVVESVPHGYVLPRVAVRSDLDDAHDLLRRAAHAGGAQELALLQRALRTADGVLVPEETGAPWLDEAREQHEARLAALRTRTAVAAAAAGRWDLALTHATEGVRHDPLEEVAWEVVVRAHLHLGHPVEALRAFDRCRHVLREQLGCAPGPGLQRALDAVLTATADDEDGLAELLQAVVAIRDRAAGRPAGERRRVLDAARRALAPLTGDRQDPPARR